MGLAASTAACGMGLVAWAWVAWRRGRCRRTVRSLNEGERRALAPYFGPGLLDGVRIAEVARLENPWVVRAAMRAGWRPPMDLTRAGGMALGDTVVLARGSEIDVLFHELVHAAQYRALGMRRFLTAYVRDWIENGRDYFAISFEEEAYALTERFRQGERFFVGA